MNRTIRVLALALALVLLIAMLLYYAQINYTSGAVVRDFSNEQATRIRQTIEATYASTQDGRDSAVNPP